MPSVPFRPAPVLAGTLAAAAALSGLGAQWAPAASASKPVPSAASRGTVPDGAAASVGVGRPWRREYVLREGETLAISARLDRPSALPANGRVAVEWRLERPASPADRISTAGQTARAVDAHGIYTPPTADWRKVLHALDSDLYLLYRAPVTGTYSLALAPVTEEPPVGAGPRWREKGSAPEIFPAPSATPWPASATAPVSVVVARTGVGSEAEAQQLGVYLETEPNDTPEQAQPIALVPSDGVRTYEVTGGADDVEYFDNGRTGRSGDDWFRLELKGSSRKLLTAQLAMPGQAVAARLRFYRLEGGVRPEVPLGALLPVSEYFGKVNPDRRYFNENRPITIEEGRDPNERVHQQEESHRANLTRIIEPGVTYYLRVEANHPGYQLQLRVLDPAPYADPVMAVRQGMYTQIGQVDAWLTNRPRGASVERRIRDSGNLLGTQCMSCHTQSGVWGPAVPLEHGYRLENVQNYWHLLNVMYECLRPTNELKDAANNTSLAPLDVGDGPAGTRAAGFNIVNAERVVPPRKLHAMQQVRTANYVLQTSDPGGINAAGPGSNVGQNIVWLFAGEILSAAWKKTGDPKYFRALEERAARVLALEPRYTDDLAVRLDFFGRVFPADAHAAESRRAAAAERAAGLPGPKEPLDPERFAARVRAQLRADEARLRAIQNGDGTWSFHPGSTPDGGKTWRRGSEEWDPAPTALAITGLTSLGFGRDDPAVARGVQALLRLQEPSGRWNRSAITGFVTTAYALRALARLYPVQPARLRRADLAPRPGESLLAAVRRVQAAALAAEPELTDLLLRAASHAGAPVRYWAMIGLGALRSDAAVPALVAGLGDRVKAVRDAAAWGLRQALLDDRGWPQALAALEHGDDFTREAAAQALGMRADAALTRSRVDWTRLGRALDRAMNEDPHPAVRAWAAKAAWQWWIWNPPIRAAVNEAWVRMLLRPEPNALTENSNRYSSHALFIANGHRANGSAEHQYRELAALFQSLRERLERSEAGGKSRLARRLVAVAATFYQTSGGDGGPGQMGYVTPGAGALFGQAVLVYLRETEPAGDRRAILAGLEGAANIPHRPLQEHLIDYALNAPEELRQAAAQAVSDPRSVMLQAATELVEPLIAQVRRGAAEPARRASLSDPVLKLFATVNWVIPSDEEQQRLFFDLLIPRLDRYFSDAEIAGTADAALRTEREREMDAAWYLADRLGGVLASNPDLHRSLVFRRYVPERFANPLQRHFWVPSVPWILEHREPAAPAEPGGVDPALVIKDRALQLYLDALRPDAEPRTRAAAVRIANTTAVRRNPEVLAALGELLRTETDPQLREIAGKVVRQGTERFVPDLAAALRAEGGPGLAPDGSVDPAFLADFTYFRDYVTPELARVKRSDQASCMGCHAVPGRVPSFTLKPVDDYGYIAVADLLFNYRELQARVDRREPARSKLLRKPLNIQDGQEDGHQGGRRYLPEDEGYLILKRWVESQARPDAPR